MKHGIHKFKLRNGQDANEMLMKKMLTNFFTHGTLTSTEKKIKALKPVVDRIAFTIQKKQATKPALMHRYFSSEELIQMVAQAVPETKSQQTSMTTIVKLNRRESDGAPMSRLMWISTLKSEPKMTEPEKKEEPTQTSKTTKTAAKKTTQKPKQSKPEQDPKVQKEQKDKNTK